MNTKLPTDSNPSSLSSEAFLGGKFTQSELVIGLVGAVGANLNDASSAIEERLEIFGYTTKIINISSDIILRIAGGLANFENEYDRINGLMDAGNEARKNATDHSILALGVAATIAADRLLNIKTKSPEPAAKRAYIIKSLKHPEEVTRLREIYPEGFYLLGIHTEKEERHKYLIEDKRLEENQAIEIMKRDENEQLEHGQGTSDTFHMSDFFLWHNDNRNQFKNSLWRILDLLFGNPYITPTFDEYAMFMAFSASLRSADLSRQVGAVVTKEREIIATGANDCPKYGGGLYWPEYDEDKLKICDEENGRDYKRGKDANQAELRSIIDDIIQQLDSEESNSSDHSELRQALESSQLGDITEYGRVVHAEMEALLSCARNAISTRDSTLYCTTFPCHNCAKHIIAAGTKRVVYIEPYPKSKAKKLHDDAISLGFSNHGEDNKVHFEAFVGVGPRRFFDLFSMKLGSGRRLKRKDKVTGNALNWEPNEAWLRMQMLPCSYTDKETIASSMFNDFLKGESDAR